MTQDKSPSIRLKVIAPDKLLVDDQVQEVSLPGLDGYLGILPGHRPLVVALGRGVITYNRSHKKENFSVRGGYAEILPERIIVFTELEKNETDKVKSDKEQG